MLSSFSKFISYPRLPLSLLKQQYFFASTSSSKGDSSSPSTGDTHQNGKDIHKPTIDASHQSGAKSQQERTVWETKEQGFTSDTETRQERIPEDKNKNMKSKPSKK